MQGGCLCGKVRYQVEERPLTVVQCHCGQCRRSVGATPVTWAVFSRRTVHFEKVRWHRSGSLSRRAFCPRCGTSLFFQHRRFLKELDITVASFDQPDLLPPLRHCFTPDRTRWVALEPGLPQHLGDTHTPLLPMAPGEVNLAINCPHPEPAVAAELPETLRRSHKSPYLSDQELVGQFMAQSGGRPGRCAALAEVYRRALSQISLQAFPDPARVQMLAEVLLPAYKYDRLQLHEALTEYTRKYPDGADYLLQPLDPKFDCSL